MSRHYGSYGRPVLLLEAYKDYRDERLALVEAGQLEEADSKADFPSFLYGPVKQSIWHGYSRAQMQYRKYARIENATDFRERRLRGLNGMSGIGYIGDHGEYPGMRRTERPAAALVVDTYGGVYAITRQAIRNDDTGELLNRNPADMGYAAGVFITETVIALIESNPNGPDGVAMYHSSRGNALTSALSEDSLVDGISALEQQLDDDSRHIIVEPQVLAVQNARMELIARRILRSSTTGVNVAYTGAAGVGSAIFDKGVDNVVSSILPDGAVVRDPYWSDANNWYLFANPNDVPAFAVGFLDGQEQPWVGLKDPMVRAALGSGADPYTYELDSIDFKVRFDFGVAPVDPRGTLRSVVA